MSGDLAEYRNKWADLNAIGMIRMTRIIDEKESIENRYFITSITDVKEFAESARKHWGVENSLH